MIKKKIINTWVGSTADGQPYLTIETEYTFWIFSWTRLKKKPYDKDLTLSNIEAEALSLLDN